MMGLCQRGDVMTGKSAVVKLAPEVNLDRVYQDILNDLALGLQPEGAEGRAKGCLMTFFSYLARQGVAPEELNLEQIQAFTFEKHRLGMNIETLQGILNDIREHYLRGLPFRWVEWVNDQAVNRWVDMWESDGIRCGSGLSE